MSLYTIDQLAVMVHNRLTQRGGAKSGFSLPEVRLIVVNSAEPLARYVLKNEALRPLLTQTFQTDPLNAGVVDISALLGGTNRLLGDGLRYATVTYADGTPMRWTADLAKLRKKTQADSFYYHYCLDGPDLRTKDKDGSLTGLNGDVVTISGVAVPDLASELPDTMVTVLLDYAVNTARGGMSNAGDQQSA